MGQWGGSSVVCVHSGCDALSLPDHAHSTCSGSGQGDTCSLACNDGFEVYIEDDADAINYDLHTKCVNGEWILNMDVPDWSCAKKDCKQPEVSPRFDFYFLLKNQLASSHHICMLLHHSNFFPLDLGCFQW
jgi:hypothetical protein